jgi:filamentous hemagglutinin family protein
MKKMKYISLLLIMTLPFSQINWAWADPAAGELPAGGNVTAGQASISQSGANMNINQATQRAAIDWQSFNIGSSAHVNFNQPSADSVALNRVLNGNPTQIFGNLTANGRVFLTNGAGIYFSPGSSVNVGSLLATTHGISNEDFMAGRYIFNRNGSTGSIINEGSLISSLGGFIALLAPEVRNEGVIVAQLGTVALAAGEAYQLQFDTQGGLSDITVSKSDIDTLVENKQAIEAPGGLIILSAQAANQLQGGVVKNSGTLEASGLVNDGGTIKLIASNSIDLEGRVNANAAPASRGNGGEVSAIADLNNPQSSISFGGTISAKGGDAGGKGGLVETSGSNFLLKNNALVDTSAPVGKTGNWLMDPYDYTIDAAAATSIVNSLTTSNVTVTTSADVAGQGSNGNPASTGNITVSSDISSASGNSLTLSAANAITVSNAISTGSLTLTAPGGISLNNNLTALTSMTLNGDVTLGADVTLTSGVSNTYTAYTDYVVPASTTSLTATLVGGSGGKGGTDTSTGGDAGAVGVLTASFAVTPGEDVFIAPGSAGVHGGNQVTNTGGSAGGTNQFNLGNGGAGGNTGPVGNSGGGAGGGAATVIALSNAPTSASQLLIAGGGGGGGGSGNNTACPSLCGGQSAVNYRNDSSMTGQTGYNAGNGASPINDGGGSGGGGGGILGGISNITIFYVNEWTGRGGNVGQSGAANGFSTTSLSTSSTSPGNSVDGYAIISYGGGTVGINGNVNGSHGLTIVDRSSNVNITGTIGGSSALTSLDITGAQGIGLSGSTVTTSGTQSFTGPLTLNSTTTSFTTTNSGITFAGDVVKGSGTSNLTVSSGSGNVAFNGKAGTSSSPLGTVSVTSTGTTSLAGTTYATSLSKLGTGKTSVVGGTVQTSGGQSYGGVLDLGGNTTLTSTGTGDISITGAVSNNTQSNLTINANSGNVTISGNLAVGTNARPTPIGDVSITASGTITLGASGATISGDAKSLTLSGAVENIYADPVTSFTCGTGSSAVGVCLTNSASFTMTSASVFSGPLAGTPSLTKSGAGTLSMSGVNTYTGNTTVNAGVLDITGTGDLGNGNYAGNIAVTGQVRFSNSVAQTLGGTMSGTGFINSPGSGVTDITSLAHADHYNLINAYAVPTGTGTSSYYGDSPSFSYQLATTAAGGTAITNASPSGTVVLAGTPSGTSTPGSYTISYSSGLSLGNEQYVLLTGNNLSWTVNPRPLTVTVSKAFDGSASFTSGFSLSGTVNGDATPSLTGGSASTPSSNAGSYTSFATNTLTQNNANYTLSGATVNATITALPINITVSKTYDGSPIFSRDFQLTGMLAADSGLTVTGGTASVNNSTAGTYTNFINNNLSFSSNNYTLTGGTISATIAPQSPVNTTTVNPPPTPVPQTTSTTPQLTLPDTSAPPQQNNNSTAPNSTVPQNDTPATNNSNTNNSTTNNPAPNSGTSDANSSTQKSVTVSLVQEPTEQTGGMVNVMVPKDTIASTGGFSFPLPEKVVAPDATNVNVTKVGGDALPSWLHFDPQTKTFTATSVPAGGLPIQVVITTGSGQTTIVIAEQTS